MVETRKKPNFPKKFCVLKFALAFLLYVSLALTCSAQSVEFDPDHERQVKVLGSAKDSLYQQLLDQYDRYILAHPADANARLERCRFIQYAYFDENAEYNPKFEEAETCARELLAAFPDDPRVLLYPVEFLYGDSLSNYLTRLEEVSENEPGWQKYRGEIFEQLANHYQYQDGESDKVIRYAEKAQEFNDTLDLSLMLAKAYLEVSNKKRAVEVLLQHLDTADETWTLNRKGKMLAELGEASKAIEIFRVVAAKDSLIENSSDLAKAMIENGLIAEARQYLAIARDKAGLWYVDHQLYQLLQYDLKYGQADSARVTYRKLTDSHFFNDPIGILRIRMIAKSPFMGWTFGDIGRVALLFVLLLGIALAPYLWVLPIHYIGNYLKQDGRLEDNAPFRWTLRHFWLACSLWLVCDVLAIVVFDYSSLISLFNDKFDAVVHEPISQQTANITLFFTCTVMLYTLAMVRRVNFGEVIEQLRTSTSLIWKGIGLALVLRVGMGFYYAVLRAFGIDLKEQAATLVSVTDEVVSVNQFYHPLLGFFIVAIIVPLYEEVLFRGIFLSACQRNMKFIIANGLQAVVFALLHEDWRLLPFFIAFGMLAGHATQKSGRLITGIAMHMTNNALVFAAMLVTRS